MWACFPWYFSFHFILDVLCPFAGFFSLSCRFEMVSCWYCASPGPMARGRYFYRLWEWGSGVRRRTATSDGFSCQNPAVDHSGPVEWWERALIGTWLFHWSIDWLIDWLIDRSRLNHLLLLFPLEASLHLPGDTLESNAGLPQNWLWRKIWFFAYWLWMETISLGIYSSWIARQRRGCQSSWVECSAKRASLCRGAASPFQLSLQQNCFLFAHNDGCLCVTLVTSSRTSLLNIFLMELKTVVFPLYFVALYSAFISVQFSLHFSKKSVTRCRESAKIRSVSSVCSVLLLYRFFIFFLILVLMHLLSYWTKSRLFSKWFSQIKNPESPLSVLL